MNDTQKDWARKIDAMLRKAESTNHPEEADAFIRSAQALMTKYAIDEAMLESARRAKGEGRDEIVEEEFVTTGNFLVAFGNLCYYILVVNDCQAVLIQNSPRKIGEKMYKNTYILKATRLQVGHRSCQVSVHQPSHAGGSLRERLV